MNDIETYIIDYNYRTEPDSTCELCGGEIIIEILIRIYGPVPMGIYTAWLLYGDKEFGTNMPKYESDYSDNRYTELCICEFCSDDLVDIYGFTVEKLNKSMERGEKFF